MSAARRPNGAWREILEWGARYVRSRGYAVSLRELHYALLSAGIHGYGTKRRDYGELSSNSAVARREGWFPRLVDNTRRVSERDPWPSPSMHEYIADLPDEYGIDLQHGQDRYVVLVIEKNTLSAQLEGIRDEFGIPLIPLRGYSSQ